MHSCMPFATNFSVAKHIPMTTQNTAILLAAFGATPPPGSSAIHAFEEEVRRAFPQVTVRWAYTSPLALRRLAKSNIEVDSVAKALTRLHLDNFTHVAVQSLNIIPGKEYETLQKQCMNIARETGLHFSLGAPLLATEADVERAADVLLQHLPPQRQPEDLVLCMGHGTAHSAAASYTALADALQKRDPRVFIGTLDGERCIEYMLPRLQATGSKTVWLLPLLSVIGKHAQHDMAGEEPGSWRYILEQEGFTCHPVLRGTAEYSGFAHMWLEHLEKAMAAL